MENLEGKRVAILATNGFEHVELSKPKEELEKRGAKTDIISVESGRIRSWKEGNWDEEFEVDKTVDSVSPQEYDALILPGGVINPDHLRRDQNAIKFVSDFLDSDKPVAAICHGPWTLAETGKLEGKRMTSYPSIKTDMKNAGANWVDEEVVKDGNLITSRKPDDIPTFVNKLVESMNVTVRETESA